jgi:PKD repeat protein
MKKVLLLSLIALLSLGAFAQGTFLTLNVTVIDANNVPVPNHAITLIDSAAMATYAFVTNAAGVVNASVTVPSPPMGASKMLFLITSDNCNNFYSANTTLPGGLSQFTWTHTFVICAQGGAGNCNANFSHTSSGLTTSLSPAAMGGQGTIYVDWGDGISTSHPASQTTPITHNYLSSGLYMVCLIHQNTAAACADTVCQPISLIQNGPQCNAHFIIDTVNSQPGTVVLWNTSSVANIGPMTQVSFNWNFGDGSTSSLAFPTHYYQNPGTYVLCLTLTATDSGISCTSQYCDTLTVDQNGNIVYKGTTLGWNLIVLDPNSIGIGENQLKEARTYPNPATDYLTIELPEALTQTRFSLYSVNGVLITEQEVIAGSQKVIDVSKLPRGIYILRLESTNSVKQVRFVKQ